MLDTLISILKESGLYAWELSCEQTEGWEFYFIRHDLDQNRAKTVRHIRLKVYALIEDGAFLGSASAELPPTATAAEARRLVEDLAYRATLVKNKPYTLGEPLPEHSAPRAQVTVDVPAIAQGFLETMQQLPETATEDINSYEIFVSARTRRLITSTGIDVTETYPDSMIEVVVNARSEGHEIELYRNYKSGSCDAEGLKKDLSRTMRYGKDRLLAKPTPALGTADVLFTTSDAVSIYEYFADRLNAQMVYRKMSDWELGAPISQDIRGDRLTLCALQSLPNSSQNRAFDAEGAPIRDTVLLQESVPVRYLGDRMFSSYLGLEGSFIPGNIAVTGGSRSEEELRKGPYLEVVEFSDFQVDAMTGDIFGEIRLAYWHDGENVTPVSGGSLSGSMLDFVKEMYLSRESVQYNNFSIPALTLLKNVTVTGIGEESKSE
ncbi:MAG: TldD/PmbA family protein [Oscillospiraceae bacterium]|nr:TldD/PmbA family protein [Oscillospiraceae bacterium]